jgi:hypothetical protein
MKDFFGFKISTLHAWKHVFTIFDSFLDPETSSRVSKTVFRLRGIPGYPGKIVPGPLRKLFEACTIVCIHVLYAALLFTTRSSTTTTTTTGPEDTVSFETWAHMLLPPTSHSLFCFVIFDPSSLSSSLLPKSWLPGFQGGSNREGIKAREEGGLRESEGRGRTESEGEAREEGLSEGGGTTMEGAREK